MFHLTVAQFQCFQSVCFFDNNTFNETYIKKGPQMFFITALLQCFQSQGKRDKKRKGSIWLWHDFNAINHGCVSLITKQSIKQTADRVGATHAHC